MEKLLLSKGREVGGEVERERERKKGPILDGEAREDLLQVVTFKLRTE